MEIADVKKTAWFATERDNLLILAERDMRDKVFSLNTGTKEFSIFHGRRKVVYGRLLKVDMSPESLLEGLDIREGQGILLLPAGV